MLIADINVYLYTGNNNILCNEFLGCLDILGFMMKGIFLSENSIAFIFHYLILYLLSLFYDQIDVFVVFYLSIKYERYMTLDGRYSLQVRNCVNGQVGALILIVKMLRVIEIVFCLFEKISFKHGILASQVQTIVD